MWMLYTQKMPSGLDTLTANEQNHLFTVLADFMMKNEASKR